MLIERGEHKTVDCKQEKDEAIYMDENQRI